MDIDYISKYVEFEKQTTEKVVLVIGDKDLINHSGLLEIYASNSTPEFIESSGLSLNFKSNNLYDIILLCSQNKLRYSTAQTVGFAKRFLKPDGLFIIFGTYLNIHNYQISYDCYLLDLLEESRKKELNPTVINGECDEFLIHLKNNALNQRWATLEYLSRVNELLYESK